MTIPSLFKEYIWLVETISEAGMISLKELDARWRQTEMSGGCRLSRTTFNRHRDAVAEIFGIFISCNIGTNEYYIMNSQVLEDDTVQKWMLTTLSVNNVIAESMSVQNRIILESIPSEGRTLRTVIEAMRKGMKIVISYQKYGNAEATDRLIEPYCIKLYHRRWYMLAKKPLANSPKERSRKGSDDAFRVFAFDRIKGVEITNEKFKIDTDFDAREYFYDCYGVVNQKDMEAQKVVLRAFGNEANNMRDLPYHHSQKEVLLGDGFADFEMFLKPTLDFQGYILSRATYVKVLEPEWLAESMRDKLEKMLGMYKKS